MASAAAGAVVPPENVRAPRENVLWILLKYLPIFAFRAKGGDVNFRDVPGSAPEKLFVRRNLLGGVCGKYWYTVNHVVTRGGINPPPL